MAVATVVVMVAVVTVTVGMAAKKKKKGMPFCARHWSHAAGPMQRTAIAGSETRKCPPPPHIRTENVIAIQTNSGTGTRKRISDWYFKRRPVCALVSKPAC
jgi:hypothetical protein